VDQFAVKFRYTHRTLYDHYCRPCRSAYRRHHYLANKQQYHRRIRERERRLAEFVAEMKARPCADCGKQYAPWQMDFDHVRGKKFLGVSQLAHQCGSVRLILAEIAKCEVVCSNCHHDRTHFRRTARTAAR